MTRKVNKGIEALGSTIILIIAAAVLFISYVRYLENTSVFYPGKDLHATPKDMGLEHEDVYFKTEDGFLLHGWFVKVPDPKLTVLYFHGNAGNVADRLDKIKLLTDMGFNIFIIDYRGYGLSDGKPSEAGLYKDAIAAYDHLVTRADVDKNKILVFGASLGGVPTIDLAAKRPVAAIVVDSSFTSAKDMARKIYSFIPSFMISLDMDNARNIKSVSVPKLFIHSRTDQTVPFYLGERLYETAPGPKEFLEVDGLHNEGYLTSQKEFVDGLNDFLKKFNLI